MDSPYTIEIEPEVRLWLMNLRDDDYLAVEYIAELLHSRPTTLGEPYSRYLGDGVRELRFSLGCNRDATRVSYWLAPAGGSFCSPSSARRGRGKCGSGTRQTCQALCEASHEAALDEYTRNVEAEKEER
ncbi:type II toxin-antitoxin system RelE/ParE family toxin [Streptomyces sp. M10(2022)]